MRVRLLLPLFSDEAAHLNLGETVETPVQQQGFAFIHSNHPGQRVLLEEVPRLVLLLLGPVVGVLRARLRRRPALRGLRGRLLGGYLVEVGVGIVRIVAAQNRVPAVVTPALAPLFLEDEVRRVETGERVRVPEERVVRRLRGQRAPHSQGGHRGVSAAAVAAAARAASRRHCSGALKHSCVSCQTEGLVYIVPLYLKITKIERYQYTHIPRIFAGNIIS